MVSDLILPRSYALVEAQRCLGCFEAPCQHACPARVDIPGFIRRFREGSLAGAGELLYTACPLALTCGLACPVDVLCQGACVLQGMGQRPVQIGALQAHVAMSYAEGQKPASCYQLTEQKNRVAVVGAGPAGLGASHVLQNAGVEVHLFDRLSRAGGLMRSVIPAYRLPDWAVETDLSRYPSNAELHCGKEVDRAFAQQILSKYSAVLLASGMNVPVKMRLPGSSLRGVWQALDLLAQVRQAEARGESFQLQAKRAVVIGGGNVALDAAITLGRTGVERVSVLYRRTKVEMPGWEREYMHACAQGVEFLWLTTITRILDRGGAARGVVVQPMGFTGQDASGRRSVGPDLSNPRHEIACDLVVFALGQAVDPKLPGMFGLSQVEDRCLGDPSACQTSDPRVFIAGEAASGGSTIVASMAQGMAAGRAMANRVLERSL